MFKKILKWIKKNTGLFIIFLLTFILLIFITVIFVKLLMGGSSNKYGNRLDGIEEVKISNDTYDEVKTESASNTENERVIKETTGTAKRHATHELPISVIVSGERERFVKSAIIAITPVTEKKYFKGVLKLLKNISKNESKTFFGVTLKTLS